MALMAIGRTPVFDKVPIAGTNLLTGCWGYLWPPQLLPAGALALQAKAIIIMPSVLPDIQKSIRNQYALLCLTLLHFFVCYL